MRPHYRGRSRHAIPAKRLLTSAISLRYDFDAILALAVHSVYQPSNCKYLASYDIMYLSPLLPFYSGISVSLIIANALRKGAMFEQGLYSFNGSGGSYGYELLK